MITRDDIQRPIGREQLDALLAEPYKYDDPERDVRMETRLTWALELGVAELALYIDLAKTTTLSVLYREYAVAFALYHLHRTTSAGASGAMQETYDATHKNLAKAHNGDRLPGKREQDSVVHAEVIEDESSCSLDKLRGLL